MPDGCCVSGVQQTLKDWKVQQLLKSKAGSLFLRDVYWRFLELDQRARAYREESKTPGVMGAVGVLAECTSRPLFMLAAALSGKLVAGLAFSSLVLSGCGQIVAVYAEAKDQDQLCLQEEERQFTEWHRLVEKHLPLLGKLQDWMEQPCKTIDRTHLERSSKWKVLGGTWDLLMAASVAIEGPAGAGLSSHGGRMTGVAFSLAGFLFNTDAIVQGLVHGRKDPKLSDALHDVADAYCQLLHELYTKRGARYTEPAQALPAMTKLTVMSIDTDSWPITDSASTRVGWDLCEHYFKLELKTRAIRTEWVPLRRGRKGQQPNVTLRFRLPPELDGEDEATFKAIFDGGPCNVPDTCHFKVALLRDECEFERGSMRFKVKRLFG